MTPSTASPAGCGRPTPRTVWEIARRVRTGTFTINGAPIGFDGPMGGFKTSGIGREYGVVGLTQFVEHKTIIL